MARRYPRRIFLFQFVRMRVRLLLFVLVLAGCQAQTEPADTAAAPTAIPGPDPLLLTDSTAPATLRAYGQQYPGSEVLISTRLGDIKVRLYDDTPVHTANFLLLTRKGSLSETVFNRVVPGFAIQGGQAIEPRQVRLRKYRLPPEFRPAHFHHKGALAMARYDDEQNPGQLSSNTDFYIVVGKKRTPAEARALAGRPLTPAQVDAYATLGGNPSLDGHYTVFGEVVEGLDVVDRIANDSIDKYNWPVQDIPLKVTVLK